jgi:serine/threonine protein kinase
LKRTFIYLYIEFNKLIKLLYYLIKFFRIYKVLKKLKLTDIKIYKYKKWHHGYCYFLAYKGNIKVFIKIDTKLLMLINEATFYDEMNTEISHYLTPLVTSLFSQNIHAVVFEYLDGYVDLDERTLLLNTQYFDDIFFILKKMKKKGVVHRDIKLNNFLVKENSIKIIDFTFSISLKKMSSYKELDINIRKNSDILRTLGMEGYPLDFQWNDFIAVKNIINKISSTHKLNDTTKSLLARHKLDFKSNSLGCTYKVYK